MDLGSISNVTKFLRQPNGHYHHAGPPLFMDSKNSKISQYEPLKILFHRVCFSKGINRVTTFYFVQLRIAKTWSYSNLINLRAISTIPSTQNEKRREFRQTRQLIQVDGTYSKLSIKSYSNPCTERLQLFLIKPHSVNLRQPKNVHFVQLRLAKSVSVNGLKSCMTDLLQFLDKVLIKAPIKMHSMPNHTRHTGVGIYVVRQTTSNKK